MSKETIGYKPQNLAQMPEVRPTFIEAKVLPRLNLQDQVINQATDKQLDFIATVLS